MSNDGEDERAGAKWFVYGTAILLIGAAVPLSITAAERLRILQQTDMVSGFQNRTVVLLGVLLHLAAGGCVFGLRGLMSQGAMSKVPT